MGAAWSNVFVLIIVDLAWIRVVVSSTGHQNLILQVVGMDTRPRAQSDFSFHKPALMS